MLIGRKSLVNGLVWLSFLGVEWSSSSYPSSHWPFYWSSLRILWWSSCQLSFSFSLWFSSGQSLVFAFFLASTFFLDKCPYSLATFFLSLFLFPFSFSFSFSFLWNLFIITFAVLYNYNIFFIIVGVNEFVVINKYDND